MMYTNTGLEKRSLTSNEMLLPSVHLSPFHDILMHWDQCAAHLGRVNRLTISKATLIADIQF